MSNQTPNDPAGDGADRPARPAPIEAVAAAADAFEAFSRTSRETRAALLDALADALEAERAALVAAADAETSLGTARLDGEVSRTAFQLRRFAGVARRGDHLDATIDTAVDAPPPAGRPDLRAMRVPLGPVAVYAASNFPFAFSTLGGDTASALAAGCTVVMKPHPGHPETSRLVAGMASRTIADAGLPAGTFVPLSDLDVAASAALVRMPNIRAVGFTGSTGAGRALLDAIGRRPDPIPFFGELGAVNPVVLTGGALGARGDALASAFAGAATLGMGQFCTKPGVLLVPEGEAGDGFVEAFAARVGEAATHPLLNDRIAAGFEAAVGAAADHAAVRVVVGDATAGTHTVLETGAADALADPALLDEMFGPAALIVRYAGADEAARVLLSIEGSLTASLHAEDDELDALAGSLLPALQRVSGRLLFEGVPPGVAVTGAMQHGGPWPSSSRSDATSVGDRAIERWLRRVAWQSAPAAVLPAELRDVGPEGLARTVDGVRTAAAVGR